MCPASGTTPQSLQVRGTKSADVVLSPGCLCSVFAVFAVYAVFAVSRCGREYAQAILLSNSAESRAAFLGFGGGTAAAAAGDVREQILDRVRLLAEACDQMQGIQAWADDLTGAQHEERCARGHIQAHGRRHARKVAPSA